MNDIVVNNLRKSFRKTVAVDGISFKVRKGEIFGLLGANGAGKTTTINMLTGLLKKDSGSIEILGKDPDKDWEYVKNSMNVGTAYYPLSDVLTVRQNLKVYGKIYNVKRLNDKISGLLEQFEITGLKNRRVIHLSSGERTRVALCKALINNPQVLFLDECTVGLDPDIAEKTRRIIKDYQKQHNCTILFTSHYMYEVEQLCNRIAFMDKGRIISISTASKLKKMIKECTIEVTVKKDAGALKKFLEDKNVNIQFAKQNTLIFDVSFERDKIYKILNQIFSRGFLLDDLHIKKPTLDDIFIRFARGRK